MQQVFEVGASGMKALNDKLLGLVNDLANSDTVAYKSSRVEFETVFSRVLQEYEHNYETDTLSPGQIEFGTGVRVAQTLRNMSQGGIEVTDNPLDMAIQGSGFFQVRMPNGDVGYTRAGNFHQDNQNQIVTSHGYILEPALTLPSGYSSVSIDNEGRVYVATTDQVNSQQIGQISLVNFNNPAGLASIGQNMYLQTESSGNPEEGYPHDAGFGSIAQNSLESSNVDVIAKLSEMVIIQRAFDLVSKSIQAGNTMMQSAIEIARS